jgi:L-iditol 2-dehydrogenase
VLDPSDGNAAEKVRESTGGHGADLVIEASGHDASLAAAFDYAREEGRMSMVGINIGRKVPVNIGQIQMKNLTVKGCIGSPGVWPAAIRFLERTGLDLSPIQTHDFALTEAVEAFAFGQDATRSIKITLLNS